MTVAEGKHPRTWELFMLALCVFALVALAVDTFFPLDAESRLILERADLVICALFLIDFVIHFARAEHRLRWFFTWGWIDLLSSIPVVDALRVGRLARVFRVFRLLRGVRATKLIAAFVLDRRAEGAALAAALITLLLLVLSSIAILQFESGPDANIKDASDALWWSFVTMTTVGYGDCFPRSGAGRIIGAMLMLGGVGLFGTISGCVAAWFLAPKNAKQQVELGALHAEIIALRADLAARK